MNAIQMLDRILDPVIAIFTPEAARRLIANRPDASFQRRLDELATKSNFGELSECELSECELSECERSEYKVYVDVIKIVSLLQPPNHEWTIGRTQQKDQKDQNIEKPSVRLSRSRLLQVENLRDSSIKV